MSNLNVLIIGPKLTDPGGVANYYNEIVPLIHNMDWVDLEYFEVGSTKAKGGIFHYLVDQLVAASKILSCRANVVVLNPSLNMKSFFRDMLFVLYALVARKKTVVFYRGWDQTFRKVMDDKLLWLFDLTYAKAHAFFVLSQEVRANLLQWGVNKPILLTTTTVPKGIVEYVKKNIETKEMKEIELKILFMARLVKKKGILETLHAIEMLVNEGVKVRLTIAGDGDDRNAIAERIEALGLQKCTVMVGYLTGIEKKDAFCNHDVFCFPTYYGEGMPNVLLEAMANGLVIITTPVGGTKDFFEDGSMGHLVDPSSDSIYSGLRKVIDNPSEMSRISQYNHSYAVENFLSDMVSERFIKELEKVAFS